MFIQREGCVDVGKSYNCRQGNLFDFKRSSTHKNTKKNFLSNPMELTINKLE